MKRFLTAALCVVSVEAHAASEGRIRTINVGAQALMTLISGIAQGKAKHLGEIVNCLGSGAAGGYGAFESKLLIRDGHVGQGWLLANLSASVSENAAAGKRPWAQAGYSIGPARVRVSFERDPDAYAYVDASFYQAMKLIVSKNHNDSMHFRHGIIVFDRREPYAVIDNGRLTQDGATWGLFPGAWTGSRVLESTRRHELVHAVQSLQGEAVEPSFKILTYSPARGDRRRLISFEHLKVGFVNFLDDRATDRQPYTERWKEIEAYRLVQRMSPTALP
ncbi:MAG TPA: hypothetical protein VJZ76_13120 [Thermoanaerobaculia bacterium]|nr:hypothetical protein [Thermoanaerobaculia bacterium]